MPKKITSLTNSQIKKVVRLRNHRSRQKEGLMIIDGVREINRALEAGINILEVFVCSEIIGDGALFLKNKNRSLSPIDVTKEVLAKISYGHRLEGMVALAEPRYYSFDDLKKPKKGLVLVLEGLEKPGNLGAILRTCDGAGVDAVIVCDSPIDLFNSNAIRSSIGTIFSMPVVMTSSQQALEFLKEHSYKVVATSPASKTKYTDHIYPSSVALIAGSESQGLSSLWLKSADTCVTIPMKGQADSLNAATSVGVVLYEIVRQRV